MLIHAPSSTHINHIIQSLALPTANYVLVDMIAHQSPLANVVLAHIQEREKAIVRHALLDIIAPLGLIFQSHALQVLIQILCHKAVALL